MNVKTTFLALIVFALSACMPAPDYDPMQFEVEGTRIIATGDIDSTTQANFQKIFSDNPGIQTLELSFVGGSVDDDANLRFAQFVRASGLKTHVPADGLIASGGTDLFLAGVARSIAPGACVGVHAWSGGQGSALDLPKDDAQHALYLRYYDSIGIARDFYWFTLAAAPAEGMHWMTVEEFARFQVVTDGSANPSSAEVCDQR